MRMSTASILRHMMASVIVTGLQIGMLETAIAADTLPIIAGYGAETRMQDPSFKGFSAARGQSLFSANHNSGKPETPSCTSCHSANPLSSGQTRAGKDIAPMALSKSPERYQDLKKVEKWFRRNCNSVLGRTCTAREKGDFLTFMMQQ